MMGLKLSIDWGDAPPIKRPQRVGIGLKCMFIAQFFNTNSMKKNQIDNFNSLGAREG